MDTAADPVAANLRQVEGLGHDALTRKGGVAVDEERQDRILLGALAGAALVHPGSHHAEHNRVHRFQM